MAQISKPNTNPIPAVLELLPYTESVLDPKLLDQIRIAIRGATQLAVTDNYILLLLAHLTDAGLVQLTSTEYVSTLGTLYIIKRELNGN